MSDIYIYEEEAEEFEETGESTKNLQCFQDQVMEIIVMAISLLLQQEVEVIGMEMDVVVMEVIHKQALSS